jgi:hypothetical protein
LARRTEKGARSRAKCSYCNKNELSLGTSDNKNEFTEELLVVKDTGEEKATIKSRERE